MLRITALVVCLGASFMQRPAAPIELPFSFDTRQPIISLKVNGGDAVPFVVDTGASIHVIDTGIVPAATASTGSARTMSGGGQGTVQAQFVDGLTLESGGVRWTDQRAAVTPLGYPKTKHFAGLIGAPILMRYAPRFDFGRKTLQLLDAASYAAPAGAVQLPFELQDGLPIVKVTIDAGSGPIEARLMVDTGASQFVELNRPFVDEHKLIEAIGPVTEANRGAAIGSPTPIVRGIAKRVVFAGRSFDGPTLGLSRATSGSSSRNDKDGVLGGDLLRHFIMTVDYRRKMLILETPQ